MTIASATNRVSYSGNGSTTAFAFSYPFRATSDLVVTVRTTSTGAESLQTEGTHYTVTGTPTTDAGGYSSGTVTFVTAPASGTQVHIDREPARTQTTDYIAGDGIPPSSIEGSLDRLTLLVQDLESRLGRTLMQPRTAANRSLVCPEPASARAGYFLAVNDLGTGFELVSTDGQTGLPAAPAYGATGPLVDIGSGSNILRFADRAFFGAAASSSGASYGTGSYTATFIREPDGLGSMYIERAATVLGVSDYGGIGITGASRVSDQYTYQGVTVWASGQSVTTGALRGQRARIYRATNSGTTGVTAPTHTSGSVSDGAVTWEFVDNTYMVPIGISACVDNDVNDGESAWGLYVEAVRRAGAGTTLATEIVVKNKGTDSVNTPYAVLSGSSTIGLWVVAGGDPSLGAPANPSTAAMVVRKNGHTWNKGIVFESVALTGADGAGGSNLGTAIALARGHKLDWHNSSGIGASIWGDVSDTAKYVQLVMTDDLFAVKVRGTTAFSVGNAQLGFFATSPTSKATITGSRGGNAALANLLTELAAKGLITDSTTA